MPAGRAHKEEKKEAVRQTTPKDLKYVAVQEKGLVMDVAKSISDRKKEMEKALKESE